MGAVNTTYTFTATDTITSTKMNNIIDQTVVTDEAIVGNTLEVAGGKLRVRAGGITSNEMGTGSVTSNAIADGTIVNEDINASAAISGSKISPNFGSQTLTCGTLSAKYSVFGDYGHTYQGITLRNNNDSAASATVSFIDFNNNLNIPDSSIFALHDTTGASGISFQVTTAGSRSTDRRFEGAFLSSNGTFSPKGINIDNTNNTTKVVIKGFNNAVTDDAIIFIPSIASDADPANACTFFAPNGTTVRGSIRIDSNSTIYGTGSDYRLKTDAEPISGALDKVANLNPVNFQWISDGSRQNGFLAHELQTVEPNCVSGQKDAVDAAGNPIYQQVDLGKLVPLLTAAIKEQQDLIKQLQERVSQLEVV